VGVNPHYLAFPLTLTLSPRGEGIKGFHSYPCKARALWQSSQIITACKIELQLGYHFFDKLVTYRAALLPDFLYRFAQARGFAAFTQGDSSSASSSTASG
jgi:hypothetical protein